MRFRRLLLGLAVGCLVLGAAGCGRVYIDRKREEARTRWAESRAEMLTKLADGCYKRGDLGRARQHLDEVIKAATPYAPAYILAARLAVEQGNLDEARNFAQMARAVDAESAEAWYVLGTVEQMLGHDAEALSAFAQAGSLDAAQPRYLLAQAGMLVATDQAEAAAALLKSAAERMPGRADVHAALGDLESLLGRPGEAAGSYRIAMRLEPQQQGLRERLAVALYASGAYADAEAILKDLEDGEPAFASGWLCRTRADCLVAMGRLDEARVLYQACGGETGGAFEPLVALASCDILENRLASARRFLEAALQRRPQDPEANALLGYVLVAEGRPGEAVPHLRLALKNPACAGRDTVEALLARAESDTAAPTP